MGMLDDVLGSSVPKGNYTKPLLIALGALLASGALHKGLAGSSTASQPATPSGGAQGGLLGGLGGCLSGSSRAARAIPSSHGSVPARTNPFHPISSARRSVRASLRPWPSGPACPSRSLRRSCLRFFRASSTNSHLMAASPRKRKSPGPAEANATLMQVASPAWENGLTT